MRMTDYFNRLSIPYLMAIGIALNLFIGTIDYVTGIDISVSIFYLIPICFVTWFVNKKAGVFMSVIGMATIPFILYLQDNPVRTIVEVWNLLLVFGFFVIVAFLLANLKEYMAEREKLVKELQTAKKEIKKLILQDWSQG
ncbi:MAG: hypothetical protein HQL09_08285 [Nitrospirae bacterium]|nr:hypothetical protein [Nitrospirota bacterium]